MDRSTTLDQFRNKFQVHVNRLTTEDMEFDLVSCDASLANAFRRILISEVKFRLSIQRYFLAFVRLGSHHKFSPITSLFVF